MKRHSEINSKVFKIYLSSVRRHYQEASDEELSNELTLRIEITKRKFTKRQLNILDIIYEFSYPFGKEKALIPRLQDFELSGISNTKIREELDKLIELNVVGEDARFGLYWLKDPDEWKVKRHNNYSSERCGELIVLNLRDGSANVENI